MANVISLKKSSRSGSSKASHEESEMVWAEELEPRGGTFPLAGALARARAWLGAFAGAWLAAAMPGVFAAAWLLPGALEGVRSFGT